VHCGYCGYTMVVHRKSRSTAYECVKRSRASGLCPQHGISTRVLDEAVWSRVERFLTDPDVIAGEFARLQSDDPTQADVDVIERGVSEAGRAWAS
jgi:hypothetical protein